MDDQAMQMNTPRHRPTGLLLLAARLLAFAVLALLPARDASATVDASGEVVKTGVSGGAGTAGGGSARANRQANRWDRQTDQPGRYEPRVVHEAPDGPGAREQILRWEIENATRLRKNRQLRDPERHTRP